eukprot:358274-Chlamydomonas_euryale.AAC.3
MKERSNRRPASTCSNRPAQVQVSLRFRQARRSAEASFKSICCGPTGLCPVAALTASSLSG